MSEFSSSFLPQKKKTWFVETKSSVAPNCLGFACRTGRRGFKPCVCPNTKHPHIGKTITGHNTGKGRESMWQPPEGGASVCERCFGLGTAIQTSTDQCRPRLGGLILAQGFGCTFSSFARVPPLRRRVISRRRWHSEDWSRQWLQLLMGPRPPSVQWPRARPHQPPKGSGKGRGRSQPAHQVPTVTASSTRSNPAVSEAAAAAKLSKLEVALSALDAESPEGKVPQECDRQDPGSCRSGSSRQAVGRVPAVHGACRQAIGVGETSSCHRSCRTGTFARRVQHRVRLEELKKEASAIPPPMRWTTSDRIQHLEALVAELRKERDDLRSHSAASKRGGEVPLEPSELVPEALEELPQWITSTSARMSMAVEREDLALVAELCAQLATGGMNLASAKRRCNPGSALVVMK